jgi:hypothetical protein
VLRTDGTALWIRALIISVLYLSLKEITGKVVFDVACMIDDVSGIEFDGVEANPYLTFISKDNEIIHLGGNSTSHEKVYGIPGGGAQALAYRQTLGRAYDRGAP